MKCRSYHGPVRQGELGVAYLAPDGFVMHLEDPGLVVDSCGRCNEPGFTGKSARDKFTLPNLVKPFENITRNA